MTGKLLRALLIAAFTSSPPPNTSIVFKLSKQITLNLTQYQLKLAKEGGRGLNNGIVVTSWHNWLSPKSKYSSENARMHVRDNSSSNASAAAIIQEVKDVINIMKSILCGGVFAFLGLLLFYFSGVLKKIIPGPGQGLGWSTANGIAAISAGGEGEGDDVSNRGSDKGGDGDRNGRGSDRGGESSGSSSVQSSMPDAPLAAKCLSLLLILMHSNSNSNKKKEKCRSSNSSSSNSNSSSSSSNGNSNGIMNGTAQGGTGNTAMERQGHGQEQESMLAHEQSLKSESLHLNERQSKGTADNILKGTSIAHPSSSSSSTSSSHSLSSPCPHPCLNPIREFFCLLQDESVVTHTQHGYGHGIHALANGKLVAGVFYQVVILIILTFSHHLILCSPPLPLRPHPHLLIKSSPSPALVIIRYEKHERQ